MVGRVGGDVLRYPDKGRQDSCLAAISVLELKDRHLYFLYNLVKVRLLDAADFTHHVAFNVPHYQLAFHIALFVQWFCEHIVRKGETVLWIVVFRRNHAQIDVALVLLQFII